MNADDIPSYLLNPVGRMAAIQEDGYRWGAAGLSRDTNPYDPFDVRARTWDEGWREGRDSRA